MPNPFRSTAAVLVFLSISLGVLPLASVWCTEDGGQTVQGSSMSSASETSSVHLDQSAPRLTPTPMSQEVADSRDEQAGEADSLDPTAEPLTYFEALPDYPLQLIRPDPAHHRKLEIVARNVKHLHYIDTAVAVVAVVGKFHSGKSFLLNQMMGKSEGFGIGPSVRPQTMGIWMWGKPMKMELPSGQPLSIVFLDTEGFAANNISETYDAKIFSVATLLSSYLIYNSVKIIDQGDIDYLELLARRTQLFALRSQITKSRWFDEFNHDLLKFPPLVWVVQDFVQTTVDEESPQEWLHRIMDTSSREEGGYDINLLGIFDTVDCHTLFLPATKKILLQDLSKAREEDLTPEYKEERDRLIAQLKAGIQPKEKNGKPITGPELATLLEILVTAANEGSLAEIPGRWEVFIDQLKVSALEDCLTFYESDMSVLLRKHNHGAVNQSELEFWHRSATEKANLLLKQLLFGLDAAIVEALEGLEKSVELNFEKTRDLNDKKIQLKCSEVQRRIEIEAEEELQKLVFPLKTVDFEAARSQIREKSIATYINDVGHLRDNVAFQRHLDRLKNGLEYIFEAARLKNKNAMEGLLKAAIEQAVERFKEASSNQNRIARTTDVFNAVVEAASSEARKVFEEQSTLAHEESLYRPFLGSLKTRLTEQTEECRNENMQLIKTVCQSQAIELTGNFRHTTGPSKMVLPVNDTELESRLKAEKATAFKAYAQTQEAFADSPAFSEVKNYLAAELEKICEQRRDENYQAYIKEVEVPLKTAMKLIMLSADRYDTAFAVTQYMKEVCLLNLDEGKAKHWQKSLKQIIAQKFIDSSPELQNIIRSKQGVWSTVKGFLQWLSWLIWG